MPTATSLMNEYRKEKGYDKYFLGKGVDIGCGPSASLDTDIFDKIESIAPYDVEQGDANYCANVPDETFDFVYSSHCLEHMFDPYVAFGNWLRICKKGGYMIHCVPHEIFYEKCNWPSMYNLDHKTSWTLEWRSNMPKTVHAPDFLDHFSEKMEIISVETILRNYDFSRFQEDQTKLHAVCQIEFIGKKK
jgi:SAM-dependent methyltransferase